MTQDPIVVTRRAEEPIYDSRWPANALNTPLMSSRCSHERAERIALILGGQLIKAGDVSVWQPEWEGSTRIVSASRSDIQVSVSDWKIEFNINGVYPTLKGTCNDGRVVEYSVDIHAGAVTAMRENNRLASKIDYDLADEFLSQLAENR